MHTLAKQIAKKGYLFNLPILKHKNLATAKFCKL